MSDQTEPIEALPCPFCGHVGLDFKEGSTFRWLAYSCGGCGTGTETRVQTLGEGSRESWLARAEQDAIKEWNTRAQPAAEPAASSINVYLIEVKHAGKGRTTWYASIDKHERRDDISDEDWANRKVTLYAYAHPAPAAEPLSDAEIERLARSYGLVFLGTGDWRNFARAVLAAHEAKR